MSKKTELNKIIKKAQLELYGMELKTKIKINKKYVGKFFKYNNGYNNDERWWMYLTIGKLSKHGDLEGWSFETTTNESVEIKKEDHSSIWEDYIEIGADEFWNAWNKLLDELKSLSKSYLPKE